MQHKLKDLCTVLTGVTLEDDDILVWKEGRRYDFRIARTLTKHQLPESFFVLRKRESAKYRSQYLAWYLDCGVGQREVRRTLKASGSKEMTKESIEEMIVVLPNVDRTEESIAAIYEGYVTQGVFECPMLIGSWSKPFMDQLMQKYIPIVKKENLETAP